MQRSLVGLIAVAVALPSGGCGLIAGVDDFRAEGNTGAGGEGTGGASSAGGAAPVCGNDAIDGVEECDGAELGGSECADVGTFYGGSLACTAGCAFDTSGCFAPPTIPVLRKPMNNTYRSRFAPGALQPRFVWEPSSLPTPSDPMASIVYHLQYGTDPTFASSTQTIEQGQTVYPPNGTAPDFIVNPVTGDHFYWRVNACVDDLCSDYSRVWHLHVKRSPGDMNGDGYDDLFIAAPYADSYVGAVTTYNGNAGFTTPTPVVQTGLAMDDFFGSALTGAGDVDGDGIGDLLVNAPGGGAFDLHLGSASGPFASPAIPIVLPSVGSNVAAGGDVDGDGYADLVVGLATEVRVYRGGPTWTGQYTSVAPPVGATAAFGAVTAPAGDLNGDGFADVVLTDYSASSFAGRAWIFFGEEAFGLTYAGQVDGPSADSQFGYTALGCDVNDDGFSDLAIGTPVYPSTAAPYGHVTLYLGAPGSPFDLTTPAKIRDLPAHDAGTYGLGLTIGCGDVDGDGFSDLVVGAPYGGSALGGQGAIQIHRGSASIPASFVNSERKFGLATNDWLGHNLTVPGDLDGDGIADIAAAAPGYGYYTPGTYTPVGYARVFFGASQAALTDGPNLMGVAGEGFGHLVGP